jgi:hypothetical protein
MEGMNNDTSCKKTHYEKKVAIWIEDEKTNQIVTGRKPKVYQPI